MNDVLQRQVIDYWFAEKARWSSDDANLNFDIERRFGKLVSLANKRGFDQWQQTSQGCLALTLLLGIFPRYLFTDTQQIQAHTDKVDAIVQQYAELQKNGEEQQQNSQWSLIIKHFYKNFL